MEPKETMPLPEKSGEGRRSGGKEEVLHRQHVGWCGNGGGRSVPRENTNMEFLVLD